MAKTKQRRLAGTVHLRDAETGEVTTYGPDDDVPADVAEQITNPAAWQSDDEPGARTTGHGAGSTRDELDDEVEERIARVGAAGAGEGEPAGRAEGEGDDGKARKSTAKKTAAKKTAAKKTAAGSADDADDDADDDDADDDGAA